MWLLPSYQCSVANHERTSSCMSIEHLSSLPKATWPVPYPATYYYFHCPRHTLCHRMLSDNTHSYFYRLTKRKMGKRPRSSRFNWIVVSILIALGLDVINGLITLPFKPTHHTHRGTNSSYSHMKIILIPRGGALLKEVYRRRGCALASSSSSGRIWNSEKNDGNVCRNPTNVDVEVALSRANNLRFACAKIAALSAIVDLLLEGKVILAGDSGRWWLSLTTLWKLSLSINVWHIARLFARIPQEQDVDKFTQGAEEILRTMTAVWRQTGIVVTLLILRKATMAWQDRIPFVRQILVTLVIGAVGATRICQVRRIRLYRWQCLKEKKTTRLRGNESAAMDELHCGPWLYVHPRSCCKVP